MMLFYFLCFLSFVFGAIIASFLNVVIDRTYNKETFIKGHSYCPVCKHKLSALDLVPLFSYLFLRAKCRYCKNKISNQYFLIEFFTAILYALIFYIFYPNYLFIIYYFILSMFLIILFVFDLRYQYVYDRFAIPTIIIASLGSIFLFKLTISSVLLAMFVGALIYIMLFYLSDGEDIGGGDMRLGILFGAIVGLDNFLYFFLISYVYALLCILFYKYILRKKIKYIPLAPFLISGIYTMIFASDLVLPVLKNIFSYIIDLMI